jgi:hypothetical protein
MKRPEPIHLSAEDGEAIIARLSVYAPTPSDCESLIVVMRLHFWLMFALQEAKLSLRRLRNVLFGKASTAKEQPESQEQTTRIEAPEPTETGVDTARVDAVAGGEADSPNSSGAVSPKPKGGHPAGTGRGQPCDIYGPARAVKGLPREKTRLGNRCSHISDLCMKASWTFGP